MISLLITPITLLVISFLIKNKDVVVVGRLLSLFLMLNISYHFGIGQEYFYLKEVLFDIAILCSAFLLKDRFRSYFLIVPCIVSMMLNLYEHISYYQTIFYPYRQYIQFGLMQIMLWGLIVGCRWRNICNKTHMQKWLLN